MIETFQTNVTISAVVENAVRAAFGPKFLRTRGELVKIGSHLDFYMVSGPVKPHVDRYQKPGYKTWGFIVINDSHQMLTGNGMQLPMPVGSVYRLDGHEIHGTEIPMGADPDGLLTFIAWDLPNNNSMSVNQFAWEALDSVTSQILNVPTVYVPDYVYRSRSPHMQRHNSE